MLSLLCDVAKLSAYVCVVVFAAFSGKVYLPYVVRESGNVSLW